LARVARRIQSDVRIDVSPRVFIGESSVQVVGDEDLEWADSSFTVGAPFPRVATSDDIWERGMFLARNFLPVGNWLDVFGGSTRVGAAQLRLSTTLRGLYQSLTGNTMVLTSQLFAVIILVGIALLFIIVELSAVRTGRSIVKGIVNDVKNLTVAARKFGEGDLSHRVELSGRDEMGQLAATFNSMAENIEQHQEVLLEKERLEADLAVAREIQQRMLPQSSPTIPGLDVAGLSIPSKEVGGDLFYFLPVSAGRLGLTIGDVSGKSVPAALLMSNVLAALKSEARIVDKEDEILVHLNRLIFEQVEPGRFVTFFYGVVDPEAHMLRYACAGHNPPLIIRENNETEWLQESGVPLGVLPEATYSPAEIPLNPGDVLVLYSDGVTEAQRATSPESETEEGSDEFYDEHRLEASVREARTMSSSAIITHVMESIRAFTDGAEQSDDVTLVVVRMAY
jgi:sigma-B regulation protein RsbU (phosphoserine phosphatase)